MKVLFFILAVVTGLALQGCGNGAEVATAPEATVVQLVEVNTRSTEEIFTFPAKVMPKSTVNLAFRVGGRLQSVHMPRVRFVNGESGTWT